DQFTGPGWSGTRSIVAGDAARIIAAIGESPDSAYYMNLLDVDGNGTISRDELGAYQFDSTAGNPTGQVNNYRIQQSGPAPYTVTTKGKTFYVQDTWTLNQWTVNAGVRAEKWGHYDSFGKEIFTFDWSYAPRLSVVYDLNGDGRSEVGGCVGRYDDPIRTDTTDSAAAGRGPA